MRSVKYGLFSIRSKPALLAVILFHWLVCLVVLPLIWASPPKNSSAPAKAPSDSSSAAPLPESRALANLQAQADGKQLEILKAEVSAQTKVIDVQVSELDHVNDITKIVLTIATLFPVILGTVSWKVVEQERRAADRQAIRQRKSFEREISALRKESTESLKKFERLRNEIVRDFPTFMRVRRNYLQNMGDLDSICARLLQSDENYKPAIPLSSQEQQRVLYYEMAVSASSFLDTSGDEKELSEVNRLFGVFYGSRFFTNFAERGGINGTDREDLERALFYFERAVEFDPQNYAAYFHAGYFTHYVEDLQLAQTSRKYFRQAAQTTEGKEYQRPWISIALLELDAFHDPDAALVALEEGSRKAKYERYSVTNSASIIGYLKACANCLKAAKEEEVETRRAFELSALEQLRLAADEPTPYIRRMFEADKSAYFSVFEKSADTALLFAELQSKFNANAVPRRDEGT